MPGPLIVRPSRAGDETGICAVCEAGFRLVTGTLLPSATVDRLVAEYYRPERVAAELSPSGASWDGYLVAEQDGSVVGAAGGGMVEPGVGQLYVIYLDPQRRGAGIGTQLLAAVSEQQQARGATRQRVAVLEDNHLGRPFYAARGFRAIGRRAYPPGAADTVSELLLERPLVGGAALI